MIKELTNFVNDLPQKVHEYQLHLEEGLYWIVGRNENGDLEILEKRVYKSEPEKDTLLEWCEKIQPLLAPVSPAKIFNPGKKIFGGSCSAFALYFNKKNLTDKKTKTSQTDAILKAAMQEYFKAAKAYCEKEEHKKWASEFEAFCMENLTRLLAEEDVQKAKADLDIHIVFNEPGLEDFREIYERYVNLKVFNKDDYNVKVDGVTYGISDSMSSFQDGKMFWRHKTAPFELNYRVNGEVAKAIWNFFKLRSRRVLPNPLPIFIDKRELNEKVVAIVNEDKTPGYSEILKKLFEDSKLEGDLGGYYLLFFRKGAITDLDYVPSFRYRLEGMAISEVFELGGRQEGKVKNVFDFENKVVSRIFDSALVSVFPDGGKAIRYFTDFSDSKDTDTKSVQRFFKDVVKKDLGTVITLVLAHRKSFYDFIYKSRQSIQSHAFHEIMVKMIVDDIRHDKELDKDYAIKEKLNIWFSLYDYFNTSPQLNPSDMVNKTQNMEARMKEIIKEGGKEAFLDDDEFAFASGQLIRNLLSQNESASRTHALLEPFLQKVEPGLFKLAIARAFDTYKHAIDFYRGSKRYAFDKIMSVVMGAEPSNGNMKDHLPMILAGYFAKSVFYSKDQDNTTTSEPNS